MKKIIAPALIALLALCTSPALAQDQGSKNKEQKMEQRVEQLNEEMIVKLKLDNNQAEKVRELNKTHAASLNELREVAKTDKQSARSKAQQLNREYDNAMLDVLSKEQYKEFRKLMAEKREQNKEKRGARGAGRHQGTGTTH